MTQPEKPLTDLIAELDEAHTKNDEYDIMENWPRISKELKQAIINKECLIISLQYKKRYELIKEAYLAMAKHLQQNGENKLSIDCLALLDQINLDGNYAAHIVEVERDRYKRQADLLREAIESYQYNFECMDCQACTNNHAQLENLSIALLQADKIRKE